MRLSEKEEALREILRNCRELCIYKYDESFVKLNIQRLRKALSDYDEAIEKEASRKGAENRRFSI